MSADTPLIILTALVTIVAWGGLAKLFCAAKKREPEAWRKLTLATLREYEREVIELETEAKAAAVTALEARRAFEATRASVAPAVVSTSSAGAA